MKYFELYKTASIYKNGLSILDVSPSLTDDEINEIDKIIGYKTVFSIDNPTQEEIREKYARNYAYYQLKSSPNRKLLFLSNYTGSANHTPDRPGNYFSHVVIFEEKKIDFSFKYFLENFKWKEILSIEEDKNYKPNLDVKEINISENDVNYKNDFDYFYNFLLNKNRMSLFLKIIDFIFTFKILEKGQNITIIDIKDNLIDWLLCINYFLPTELSELITFASYVASPKELPFKLTGVIPDCNVNNLGDYFTVFDAQEILEYTPKHLYTKQITRQIQGKKFSDWLNFSNKISNISFKELNTFLTKYDYISEIGNTSTIEDYKKRCITLPREEKEEIWQKLYNENLSLYDEIVNAETENKISNISNIENYKDILSNIYITFVEGKEEYRRLYFDGLITTFYNHINSTEISKELDLYILLNSDCNTNEKKQLKILLQKIDSNFGNYFEEIEKSIDSVTELDIQYNINSLNFETPNIKKIMKFKEIIQEAKKDNFINEIRKHNNFLQNASVKEKRKLFLIAFNNDKYFLKKNFKNFSNYIDLINKYLNDDHPIFWAEFFDKNRDFEKNKDYTYHSLDDLKKRFVADIFLSEYNNLQILEKMDFTDEYTMKWINEAVTEETDREAILNRFLEYFKNNKHIDNNKSWFSNLNPFKK